MLIWGTGVLWLRASLACQIDPPPIQLEFHVRCVRGPAIGAIVEHIVIRLNNRVHDLDSDDLAAMQYHMMQLSDLRTVTLEVPCEHADAGLADKFPILRFNNQVRVRTCKEAEGIAGAAMQNSASYSRDRGVASPLWHLGGGSDMMEQYQWCVNLSRIAVCQLEHLRIQVEVR